MGVVPVGVAPANKAVPPEDEDIASLISGNSAGGLKRFLLGVEVTGNPFGACLADGPPISARHNILSFV